MTGSGVVPNGSIATQNGIAHTVLQVQPFFIGHYIDILTLKVLVATIDTQWEGMGDVGLARYEPPLLSPCPTIRVLSYSN